MKVTLPYPPSINAYWRFRKKGGVYKTETARAYAWDALAVVGERAPMEGLLSVTLHVYRPQKSGDLDNRVKLILDVLQDVLYYDDSQIVEIHAYRHDDRKNPRVEVEITPCSQ